MATILSSKETLHRAILWLSDERKGNPQRNALSLVEEAAFRFDLSPSEEEWMIETFVRPPALPDDAREALRHAWVAKRALLEARLQALEAGAAFTCESCGGALGFERLDAQPWTTLCAACAAARH